MSARRVWWIVQTLFVVAVVVYGAVAIADNWIALRGRAATLDPRWSFVLLASVLVLGAYALLIATWRGMLAAWGASLPFGEAARIWFVSNLGKYIPGKVWQIAAMGAMAQQRGVSPVAAAGSALVVNLANIVSGFGIVLVTGAGVLRISNPAGSYIAMAIVATALAGLLALPVLLPLLMRLAGRAIGRDVAAPAIPARAVWLATLGTGLSWVIYGLAFQLLAVALDAVPSASSTGAVPGFIAVYTASYLIGYLSLVAPGGIVVRETMLVEGLLALGLAHAPAGWLLAVASRLWLTVLEVAPGLLFLVRGSLRRPTTLPDDGTSH